MSLNRPLLIAAPLVAVWVLLPGRPCQGAQVLTLEQAEHIALEQDLVIQARSANAAALRDKAVADGQWSDPQLTAGVFNLPLDSFSLDDEPSTQIRFGVVQALPRGRTLGLKQKQTESQAELEEARSRERRLKTRRGVREAFFEIYFQTHALEIIGQSRGLFEQLVEITEGQYASGRDTQQDVLRALLELSRLADRETRIREADSKGRAELGRWIGTRAYDPLAKAFPRLPDPPGPEAVQGALPGHPLMRVEDARVQASKLGVRIAGEQYKPGFSVGVEYRYRKGDNPDGSDRNDMMAAMVRMDLPIFTAKRQDQRYAASQQREAAARLMRQDRLLELKRMLDATHASWLRTGQRHALYDQRLLPEARSNAQASLRAYQSGVSEFTTLMRARLTELEVRLEALRLRVDRAKAQAMLLYLAGDET